MKAYWHWSYWQQLTANYELHRDDTASEHGELMGYTTDIMGSEI